MSRGARMTRLVLGREAERAAVMAVLTEPPIDTRVLVLYGEAGIGKSALWHEALRVADGQGWRTLASQPAEADASLPFTVRGDLCDSLLEDYGSSLAGPQQRAIEIALLRSEATGVRPDVRGVALATRNVLRAAAEAGPLV